MVSKIAVPNSHRPDLTRSAANSAAYIQETTGRFRFAVNIKTPIVVLPRPLEQSEDMLEAYLGEITCSNRFLDAAGRPFASTSAEARVVNEISLDVRSMKLLSVISLDSNNTFVQRLPIIRDINWKMTLKFNEGIQDAVVPALQVTTDLRDASVQMTEKQYALVLEVLEHITRSEGGPGTPSPSQATAADEGNSPSLVAERSEEALVPPFASMDVSVSLNTLGLDIFTADSMEVGEAALVRTGLGQFFVNGIVINAALSSRGDIAFEVVVNSLTVLDTRPDNPSVFKEVVPSNTYGKNKLVMQYTRNSDGATDMVLSLDGMSSILSIRYISDIWTFFMVPKYYRHLPKSTTDDVAAGTSSPVEISNQLPSDEASPPPFTYRVNIVDAEITVLGDPMVKETEAILLAVSQINLVQDVGTTTLSMKQVIGNLVNMDKRHANRSVW